MKIPYNHYYPKKFMITTG